jgi:hypothetical protein
MTVTDPADIDPCSGCSGTSGVQPITGTSPRVQAWSCTACRANWASTAVKSQPYCDRLAAAIEQLIAPRSLLRQVITMADDATTLSDREFVGEAVSTCRQGQVGQFRSGVLRPRLAAV